MQGDKDSSKSANAAAPASECPFLSEYDSLSAIPEKAKLLKEWLAHHPAELFAELRAQRPVLRTGGPIPTIVARSADVMQVLSENKAFPVTPYQNLINTTPPPAGLGHFLLADLELDRHDREKEVFAKAMRSGEECRADIRRHADVLIGAAGKRSKREIDVIKDVAERLPIRNFNTYFGVPTTGDTGEMPDGDMYLLIGRIFHGLFMNPPPEVDAVVQANAVAASGTLRAYVDKQLQARKAEVLASSSIPADLLGRFIRLQGRPESDCRDVFPSDERVVANLCGIMTGAVMGIVQSIGNIVYVLINEKPAVWDGAVSAATGDDMDRLWTYAQEALRFRPQGPGIFRGTTGVMPLSGETLPAGSDIFASHQSAMMDEALVPDPLEFRLDRPASSYLHFGFARNKCLGIHLAPVIITEGLRAILRLRNLRRPPQSEIVMGKPYPESFILSYDG